jgi:hypothetical protein
MFRTNVVKKIRTYILCLVIFLQNRSTHQIMWENTVQPKRRQTTIWRMRISCWVPKATNIHSEYVIVIAFLLQQWLHEGDSMLRYTYSSSLVWCLNLVEYSSLVIQKYGYFRGHTKAACLLLERTVPLVNVYLLTYSMEHSPS